MTTRGPFFPLCLLGTHSRVLDEAGGMMADAYVCVDCGREKYPEVFGIAVNRRRMPLNDEGFLTSGDAPYETRLALWNRAND